MSGWRFEITAVAENDLEIIGEPARKRILEKIKWFEKNFEQVRHSSPG